ncbi:MAG: ABC transporter permease [Actinomycetota bacterium]
MRQVRFQNKAFWRNPAAAFFTFAFPLMFLVIFTSLFGNDTVCLPGPEGPCALEISTSTFYVASITAFSVITACYTNIAMGVAFSREEGTLKRIRGTPLRAWSYLAARILHAVFVTLILVVLCVAFGAAFYDASVPISTLPEFVLVLVVGAASFCALGLAATALIPNADAGPPIVNATILPLLFLSDVFIPLRDNAPAVVTLIAQIFPIKHFVDALVAAYFPVPGEPTFLGGDLLIVAAWGVAGVLLAVKFFTWEPKGGR